jgi:hypothetical protein
MASIEHFRELALKKPYLLTLPTCCQAESRWLRVIGQGVSQPDGTIVDNQDPSFVLATPTVMNLIYTRDHEANTFLREALPELPQEVYPDQVVLLKNPNRINIALQRQPNIIGAITLIDGNVYLTKLNRGYGDGEITRPWIGKTEPVVKVLKDLMLRNSTAFPHVN